jgi:hypothetical protein
MKKMRDVNELIGDIKSKKEFQRLKTSDQIKLICDTLPSKITRYFSYGYIKNSILYFVFSHPVSLSEFNNSKSFVLKNIEILKEYGKIDIKVDDVKAYVSKFIKSGIKVWKYNGYNIKLKEKSKGLFKNSFSNQELYKEFEKIRNDVNQINKEKNEN